METNNAKDEKMEVVEIHPNGLIELKTPEIKPTFQITPNLIEVEEF
jgi:hypothetical protein